MKQYFTPDFDVTVYEIEDVITLSIGGNDADKPIEGEDWYGWFNQKINGLLFVVRIFYAVLEKSGG